MTGKARRHRGTEARRGEQYPDREGADQVEVVVTSRLRKRWPDVPLLRRAAYHALAAEGFRSGHLSVAVVGARAMATLHRCFLNIPGPTDVLAFDFGCDLKRGTLDAEIVLCADVARQSARTRGDTLRAAREELALYLVHGILHLAGYDDHTSGGFRRMHRREDQLLAELGVGRVFSAGI